MKISRLLMVTGLALICFLPLNAGDIDSSAVEAGSLSPEIAEDTLAIELNSGNIPPGLPRDERANKNNILLCNEDSPRLAEGSTQLPDSLAEKADPVEPEDSSAVSGTTASGAEVDSLKLAADSTGKKTDTPAALDDSISVDSVVAVPYKPPNRPLSSNPRALRYNGIYLTGYSASSTKKVENLIEESRGTVVGGFVMDMKDDQGHLTYRSEHPLSRLIGSGTDRLRNPKLLVDRLHEEGLIATARVVCFKDPILAGYAGPDSTFPFAVHDSATGQPWQQDNGEIWANPYHPEVREYLTCIVEELVCFGFDQIQLDYIRFPSDGDISRCVYPVKIDSLNRAGMIGNFLSGIRAEVDEQGISLAADVFGWVPWLNGNRAFKIGQDYDVIASYVDVVCPMLYASHFPVDFKAEHKERRAYEIYREGTRKAVERRGERSAGVQPYVQGFRWRAPYYGTRYIAEQMEASRTEGAVGWIVWNAGNRYEDLWETLDSLKTAAGMTSR